MSSVEALRKLVTDRLTAAAEDIFGIFLKTIVVYEEEIHRQRRLLEGARNDNRFYRIVRQEADTLTLTPADERWDHNEAEPSWDHQLLFTGSGQHQNQEEIKCQYKLLDISLNPPITLEASQQEDVLPVLQLDLNSSLDQDDPEPPQILQLQEKQSTSWDDWQHLPKQDIGTQTLKQEKDYNDPEPTSLQSEKQNQTANEHLVSAMNKEREVKEMSNEHRRNRTNLTNTDKKSFKCKTCGKEFKHRSKFLRHMKIHPSQKKYCCKTCGKAFDRNSRLVCHMRSHANEEFSCKTCGKGFDKKSQHVRHMKTHAGENGFSCKQCGNRFAAKKNLLMHMSGHTAERCSSHDRRYSCDTCGNRYTTQSSVRRHMACHPQTRSSKLNSPKRGCNKMK